MIKSLSLALAMAVALVGVACEPTATNTSTGNSNRANTNANANAAQPVAAAPTKEALFALEKQGWEGWKNRDPKVFETLLSDKYVGFGAAGRMDKAANVKSLTEQKCEIKSYSFSDEQMTPVGADVAILTFKAAQDGVCDGKPIPASVWSAAVYARDGDAWKAVYYSESPAVDPKSTPAKAEAAPPAAAASPAAAQTAADPILAVEKSVWEAWKNKDEKALQSTLGDSFMWVAGEGRADRAGVIKMWATENKCDVKSYDLTDAKTVSLSSDVSLLTYKGAATGSCDGQPVRTQWYGAVHQKSGETWKPVFGTSVM